MKKVVITGSVKLQAEINNWTNFFKNNNYESQGAIFNEQVNKILNNATRFNGPCGGYDFDEDGILNEDLCEQFNLTCDRW